VEEPPNAPSCTQQPHPPANPEVPQTYATVPKLGMGALIRWARREHEEELQVRFQLSLSMGWLLTVVLWAAGLGRQGS
jgi:hypothetical protein